MFEEQNFPPAEVCRLPGERLCTVPVAVKHVIGGAQPRRRMSKAAFPGVPAGGMSREKDAEGVVAAYLAPAKEDLL
jgi:hypothetical protein